MANNRLYIGNRDEAEYCLIAKGFGNGWRGIKTKTLEKFLNDRISETDVGGKTSLFLFTEYDDEYGQIMGNWIDTGDSS